MTLLLAGLGVLVGASLLSARRRAFAIAGIVIGGTLSAIPAVGVLASGATIEARLASGLPGGDWVLSLDPLGAVFVLVVLFVGGCCLAWGHAYDESGKNGAHFPRHTRFTGAVLVSVIVLVAAAGSITLFMAAWELMAIASFVLILTEHERPDVRRAGLLYLVLTHTATLALFVMFALWTRDATDWTFASLAARGIPSGKAGFALLSCAIVGFGMKAGLVPAHFWLPPAHAAAPSHVSAIMSGLVIKTGIYGLLRVVSLAGGLPAWWGWTLFLGGVASAVGGVLWALAQHDIKRLLAFHSVENVGIIAMGIGLGGLGTAYGSPVLAVLGYGAAILHTANHAIFKALLFLAAGAVVRATGTRNLEEMGGLARRMPQTWSAFAIGAAAIVGLPPLNGFVSEWLLFLGLFEAAESPDAVRVAVLGAPALALVGGLALACFSKVAGVAFLGRPRSAGAAEAGEVASPLRMSAWILALACVGIGIGAALVVPPVLAVAAGVAGIAPGSTSAGLSFAVEGAMQVTVSALLLVGAFVAASFVRRRWGRRAPLGADDTWECGWTEQTPRMQYTASSFAGPLIRAFGALAGVREHRGATVFHSAPRDLVLDTAALPTWRTVRRWALRLRPMQQGRLNLYLLYVIATLVALLAYAALAPEMTP